VVSSLIVFISSLILAVISNFEFWIFKDYVIRSIMSLIPGLIYLLIRNFKHKKTEEKLNISLNKKPRSIVQLILIIVVPILLLFLAMVYLMRNFQL
jgi:Zn-dependent protease with chaperone function